jgi:SAM-dependent methyltransferase
VIQRVSRWEAWWHGPFGFQPNNTTRLIEYPWAYHVAPWRRGLRVIEVGGALSGFQFVLARSGAHVINVDPFLDYGGGGYAKHPAALHATLNRYFGTSVRLLLSTLPEARLESESCDRVYCLSTIEHLGAAEVTSIVREVGRVLRPGGLFVLTIDLFLNLHPFTARTRNEWGSNISVADLVTESGMNLVFGEERELCGFEAFAAHRILENLECYLIGELYPALVQMVVLMKGGSVGGDSIRRDLFPTPARPDQQI